MEESEFGIDNKVLFGTGDIAFNLQFLNQPNSFSNAFYNSRAVLCYNFRLARTEKLLYSLVMFGNFRIRPFLKIYREGLQELMGELHALLEDIFGGCRHCA